jgi:hypothetical protein
VKGEIMSNTSRTNWAKIDAMTNDDIDTSDIPPLTDEFFLKAKLRMPFRPNSTVAVSVDSKTLEWFRSKGEESEQHSGGTKNLRSSTENGCWDIQVYLSSGFNSATRRLRQRA